MILATMLSLASVQSTLPEPGESRAPDIVVAAMRKLEDWRGVLVFERDTPECRVVKSANDADLDAIGCKSMVHCYVEARPRFLALNDRTLTARTRNRLRIAANRDMDACFKISRQAMVQDLTRRREAVAAAEDAK